MIQGALYSMPTPVVRVGAPHRGRRNLVYNMSQHMSFIGQRADKAIVKEVKGVEEIEQEDGIRREGVVKKVEHYTVSCDECGGDGYYDQRGEIVCEGCGRVLSGDHQPVIPTEYNADADDSVGSSRGLEKMGGTPGTKEPRGV